MVNTELAEYHYPRVENYNILNIVVNTELVRKSPDLLNYYNILNIVVNTEHQLSYTL